MKRLSCSVLLSLLICTPCSAQMLQGICGGGGSALVAVFGCTDADLIFCEGFDSDQDCGDDAAGATNCRETWVVANQDADRVVTFAATASGTLGGKAGTYVADIYDNSASSGSLTITSNTNSTPAQSYTQFYINLVQNTPTDTAYTSVETCKESGCTNLPWQLRLIRTGATTYKMTLSYKNHSDAGTLFDSTNPSSLSINTWYGVRIYWKTNQVSAGIAFYIDGNLSGTFVDQSVSDTGTATSASLLTNYFSAGRSSAANVKSRVQLDMIKISTSAFPAAEVP